MELIGFQHHIFQFEVSVHNPLVVEQLDRPEDLSDDLLEVVLWVVSLKINFVIRVVWWLKTVLVILHLALITWMLILVLDDTIQRPSGAVLHHQMHELLVLENLIKPDATWTVSIFLLSLMNFYQVEDFIRKDFFFDIGLGFFESFNSKDLLVWFSKDRQAAFW